MLLLMSLAVCLMAQTGAEILMAGLSNQCYTQPGDVLIGLIGPATEADSSGACQNMTLDIYMEIIEAFVYGINEINSRPDLLPNTTVGFVILDTCNVYRMITGQSLYLIPDNVSVPPQEVTPCTGLDKQHYDVIAVVGDYRSNTMLPLALVMTAAQIPVMGTYQSSDELSNQDRFGYLVRLLPPDKYQTQAILQLLAHHNWTYFTLIYEEGGYGENGAKNIQKGAAYHGLCIEHAMAIYSSTSEHNIVDIMKHLAFYAKSRAVVLFMSHSTADRLFEHLPEHLYNYFIWIGSDGLQFGQMGPASDGMLVIQTDYGHHHLFEAYYRSLGSVTNPANPWISLPRYCQWTAADAHEEPCQSATVEATSPEDVTFLGLSLKHIDAVYTLAHGLHALIHSHCPRTTTNTTDLHTCIDSSTYLQFIKNVSFQGYTSYIEFDDNGEVLTNYTITQYSSVRDSSVEVGMWNTKEAKLDMYSHLIDWSLYSRPQFSDSEFILEGVVELPHSVCSEPCDVHQYLIPKEAMCCFECRHCRNNEIVIKNGTSCDACAENTWPDDETATTCEVIPPVFLQWSDTIGVIFLFLTSAGLILTSTISFLMIKHREAKLIKASSRELIGLILAGIHLAFLSVFTTLMTPHKGTCFLRDLGFSVSVTLIYAPLLVKTVRVYRIFRSSLEGNRGLVLVSRRAQIILSLALIGLQTLLTVIVGTVSPSEPHTSMPLQTKKYSELFCTLPPGVLAVLIGFNLMLLVTCAVFGFLTRKLPENFNESWFIFVSVSTTIFLWVAFFPMYFTTFYAYHKVALLGLSLVLNGYITLLCLFVPKLYAVYFVEDEELKFGSTLAKTQATSIKVSPMPAGD